MRNLIVVPARDLSQVGHNVRMRGYVGVTDDRWYQFLASRPEGSVSEVNFWRPGGGGGFREETLAVGEPFFFKTHAPHNRVVGGGFYSGFASLPVSEAWQLLDEANGMATQRQMLERIAHYRGEVVTPFYDPVIGCDFVRDVTFFPDGITFDPPPGFKLSIVQGKSYDMGDPQFARYFGDLMQLVLGKPLPAEIDLGRPWHDSGPVFGEPRLAPRRLGQKSFKGVVLSAYHGRCAITGTKIRPVLEATHIRPVSPTHGGENRLDNGLLLRSDVHTMFDRGYLAVDPAHRLLVSPRLRTDFGNGEQFYSKAGSVIALPDRKPDRPGREFLEWHLDTIFKAS
jgi:putative restriction endonuclease